MARILSQKSDASERLMEIRNILQQKQGAEAEHRYLDISESMQRYEDADRGMKGLRDTVNAGVIRLPAKCDIFGITSTSAASSMGLITSLGAQIVLCEEAAELLEAHVLAVLSASTQQLILLGDHEQLRPKVDQYLLSCDSRRGYDLDKSLMERLVYDLGAEHVTLSTQWRMRPEIADLIRRTGIYPRLLDAPKVNTYPDVPGMGRNLFFWTATDPEGGGSDVDGRSKFNLPEAQRAVALAKHLAMQGCFETEDIAILSMYVEQAAMIKQLLGGEDLVVTSERDQKQIDEVLEMAEEAAEAGSSQLAALQEQRREIQRLRAKIGDPRAAKGPGSPHGKKAAVREASRASCRIKVATTDNFQASRDLTPAPWRCDRRLGRNSQGEEAKVVILSLVRCNDALRMGFIGG